MSKSYRSECGRFIVSWSNFRKDKPWNLMVSENGGPFRYLSCHKTAERAKEIAADKAAGR